MRVEAGIPSLSPSDAGTAGIVLLVGPGEADEEDEGGGDGGEVSSSGGAAGRVLESSSVVS